MGFGEPDLVDQEDWVTVTTSEALQPGDMTGTKIGATDIAVFNVDGAFYATDNVCSHAYALLTDGYLEGDMIECPMHGGMFEVKTGRAACAPVVTNIKTYETRLVGNEVQVRVASNAARVASCPTWIAAS